MALCKVIIFNTTVVVLCSTLLKKVLKLGTIALDVNVGYQWNVRPSTLMNHSDV